jgi:hypothetical protein
MYLLINKFDKNNLFLSEKQKNNILQGSDFYRLYYSDFNITLNGIFLNYDIKNINIQKYFNKIKCMFDGKENIKSVNNIINIEKNILLVFKSILNRQPIYTIEEQLKQNFIKIFTEKNADYGNHEKINIILKLSGLWVDKENFGLTFRFLINHPQ